MFKTIDTTSLETTCGGAGVWNPQPWAFKLLASQQGRLDIPKLSTTEAHTRSTTFPPPYTTR